MKSFWFRVLIAIDQFMNVLVLNGNPDQTVSGHVGYKSWTTGKTRWRVAEKFINTLFWFDPNHCRKSIDWDEVNS